MYELCPLDRSVGSILALDAYKVYVKQQTKKVFCFGSRLFIDCDDRQLKTLQADLIEWSARNSLTRPLQSASFIPAPWLKEVMKLTYHYPAAYRQLELAREQNLSVEQFMANVALVFCQDWKLALKSIEQIEASKKNVPNIPIDPHAPNRLPDL